VDLSFFEGPEAGLLLKVYQEDFALVVKLTAFVAWSSFSHYCGLIFFVFLADTLQSSQASFMVLSALHEAYLGLGRLKLGWFVADCLPSLFFMLV
jgi:exosortase/archaeosortase